MSQYPSGFTPDPPKQQQVEGFTPDQAAPQSAPDARTASQVAMDQVQNVIRGVPQAVTAIPGTVATLARGMTGNPAETVRNIRDMIMGVTQPAVTAAKGAANLAGGTQIPTGVLGGSISIPQYSSPEGNPANPVWGQAAQGAGANLGALMLPEVAGRIAEVIPSKVRAGANLNIIENAAGRLPINPAAMDAVASRYGELTATGDPNVNMMEKYLTRREDPLKGPITYKEGRDFATKAGDLSQEEKAASSKRMKAQIVKFSDALKTANREAASQVGMGELYDAAIKEYRQASTIADKTAIIKKWVIPALITLGGGGKLIRDLLNK